MRISYLTCPHRDVQQFTECCLNCGFNIYTTREEYLKYLKKEVESQKLDQTTAEIIELERKLGIK